MFKSVSFYGSFNNQTGYGFHATQFCNALEKLISVKRNQLGGEVSISLIDSVSIQNINVRPAHKFNILYNVWESTEQPQWFMDRLKYFDQLWVPSEEQRNWSILQGVPEEFVKVVPEGIDPDIFKPVKPAIKVADTFNFLHIGQWQHRKSTLEICQSFIKAFPNNLKVRLYLAAETHFPSDQYKSTQERLEAYGVNDKRIIPLAFDDHLDNEKLLKLFAKTDCFVSCSRSEGWGMPICLAMACGIPTIASNWGGSTEYTSPNSAAYVVQVPETKKPQGIYGNWDVPGKWGEPNYDDLIIGLRTLYDDYEYWKKLAYEDSGRIRKEFSWDAAAQKAYTFLKEIDTSFSINPEDEIRAFARDRGYEVTSLRRSKAIFVVDCWPDNQTKINTLIETIDQIHGMGYPVFITSHYALPAPIIQKADYYLYEQRDIMSGDDKPIYHRVKNGVVEQKPCNKEYQGVAAVNCFRNAIDFCKGRFDWIYQMCSDIEVDLDDWLNKVYTANKPMVCIPYEGKQDGIGGGLWAGKSDILDKVIPYLNSWKEYADKYPDVRFVVERWLFNHVSSVVDINESIEWINIQTSNRFDNVDRTVWTDDEFSLSFIDGARVQISGLSDREYSVSFGTLANPNVYVAAQKPGMWSSPNIKYYQDWTVKAYYDGKLKYEETINLEGKRVLISMGSKALGDTVAWIPYVDEFRKKHKCYVICSTWWNGVMNYPDIEFVHPGTQIADIYALYTIGCFDGQPDRNPVDWRQTPLQKVSSDILGLSYTPIRPSLKIIDKPLASDLGNTALQYMCFSEHSTMQNKLWNRPGAWQSIIDYVNALGYIPVSISAEPTALRNVISHNGQPIEDTILDIANCAFYIGLNHGPIWLAYSLNKPAIMLTGVSEPWNDFENPYRVSTNVCRPGCFNDPSLPMDRSWNWCPRKKDYICTASITEEMVIEKINTIHEELQNASNKEAITQR